MKRRLLLFLSLVVMILVVILALLPRIISTDTIKDRVVQMIEARIPGDLAVSQWSLRWFGGLRVSGVTYEDHQRNYSAHVDQIDISKGLLALMRNYHQPGRIDVLNPHLRMTLPEKMTHTIPDQDYQSSLDATSSASPKKGPATNAGATSRKNTTAFKLPPVVADLDIRGGKIDVTYHDKNKKVMIEDLTLNLNIDAPKKTAAYHLLVRPGSDNGKISGEGTVVLPSEGGITADSIKSKADIVIADWDVAPVSAVITALYGYPAAEGRLNGQFQVAGSAVTEVKLTGQLRGNDIRLSGGGLKTDTPFVKNFTCDVDAIQAAEGLTVNHLTFDSPLAKGSVRGHWRPKGERQLQGETTLNLKEIFKQLPETLNLKPGTTITDGMVALEATVASDAHRTRYEGQLQLDRLAGMSGKKQLAWDEPLNVDIKGSYGDNGIHLDKLNIQSAFMSAEGQGNWDNLNVHLKADLKAAFKEAGTFIDTQGWKGVGQMDLTVNAGSRSDQIHFVKADLEIDGLQLNRQQQVIVPKSRFTTQLTTDLKLDKNSRPASLSQTAIDFDSWMGAANVQMDQLVFDSQGKPASVESFSTKGRYSLEMFSTLARALGQLPAETQLKGMAAIETRLSSDLKTIQLGNSKIDIDNFSYIQAKRRIQDKKVKINTAGRIDLAARSARLTPLNIETTAGTIAIPELLIENWADIRHAIKGDGKIGLDLAALTQSLESDPKRPPKIDITGKSEIGLKADLTPSDKQTIRFKAAFAPLKIDMGGKPLVAEDRVNLDVDLEGNLDNNNLVLKQLALAATPLSINATGRMSHRGEAQQVTIDGDLSLDLEQLQGPLNEMAGTSLALTGKSKRPFSLQLETAKGNWQDLKRKATISAALHADQIRGFGLALASVDMPVSLKNGQAQITLSGKVNDGELALQPVIDLAATPPMLSMPADSQVLSGAQMTEAMANQLLALIHPIFKGTTAAEGTVDLVMQQMSWPLAKAARQDARFNGLLKFKNVRLNAEGLMYELLKVMKVKERDLFLDERTIEFSGQDGRIQCSPLKISVKGYQMEVGGTMGFDGSLDYSAKIQLTREIVGDKVYPYVKDTFIDIPISGTLSKPKLNRDELKKVVQQVLQQSGRRVIEEKAGDLLKRLIK